VAADKLGLAQVAQQPLRSNTQVLIFRDEEAQLVGEIEVSFVVGRGGQHDALTLVLLHVFLNCAVSLAFTVA